jgi:hypothetical protein
MGTVAERRVGVKLTITGKLQAIVWFLPASAAERG